jgi:hypothetical protein
LTSWAAVVLAIALVAAAILHGGIYELRASGSTEQPIVWRLNRLTGTVDMCNASTCADTAWLKLNRPN